MEKRNKIIMSITILTLLIFMFLFYTPVFLFKSFNTEKVFTQKMKSYQTCIRPCHIYLDGKGNLDVNDWNKDFNSACRVLPAEQNYPTGSVSSTGIEFACTTVIVLNDQCDKAIKCKTENNNCVTYADNVQLKRCSNYIDMREKLKEAVANLIQ